jgi:hypothetical protein
MRKPDGGTSYREAPRLYRNRQDGPSCPCPASPFAAFPPAARPGIGHGAESYARVGRGTAARSQAHPRADRITLPHPPNGSAWLPTARSASYSAVILRRRIRRCSEWFLHAACRGEQLEVFFPPSGVSFARALDICRPRARHLPGLHCHRGMPGGRRPRGGGGSSSVRRPRRPHGAGAPPRSQRGRARAPEHFPDPTARTNVPRSSSPAPNEELRQEPRTPVVRPSPAGPRPLDGLKPPLSSTDGTARNTRRRSS